MADELNTPNHRYYQPRYNIPLTKDDISRQWIYASGISKIDAWIDLLAGRDYSILGFEPLFVTDFGRENYRVQGAGTNFSSSITHSRAGNATMVDSDGVLKWAPHNLLTYSEDAASTNKGRVTVVSADIDGPLSGTTADKITQADGETSGGFIGTLSGEVVNGVENTYKAIVKNGDCDWVRIQMNSSPTSKTVWFDILNGAVGTEESGASGSIVSLGNGWYEITAVIDDPNNFCLIYLCDGDTSTTAVPGEFFYLHRRQNSRTDLGGMVDNPDRGDSYVPTTSSAVYLPRRGHHVYNGSAWVNEGLLVESEARVNLLVQSNDFSSGTGAWAAGTVIPLAQNFTGPDGEANSAWTLEADGANTNAQLNENVTVATNTAHTLSVFVKAGTANFFSFALAGFTTPSGVPRAYFNVSTGTLGTIAAGFDGGALIEDFGNGWYRCSVTFTTDASDTSGQIYFVVSDADADVSAGDGSNVYIWGAQLEAGSTPSSYIPTNSGATVTRAAETLTVPAANLPWPSPVVIGEELFSDFAAEGEWVDNGDGSWTVTNATAYTDLRMDGLTTIGKHYQYTFDITTTSNLVVYTNQLSPVSRATGSYTENNVATSLIFIFRATAGTTATISNISVKEINPLSVSIQMQGEMTTPDVSGFLTNIPVNWSLDGNNQIRIWTDTTAGTGMRWDFDQEANNQIDQVSSGAGATPTGVNVPFNIASRHGSTFINGAVDGTALTADTTPVALPDLSATDLQIGYDFMGTIRQFRMWSDDLGDAGIATASEGEPSSYLLWDATADTYVQRIYS